MKKPVNDATATEKTRDKKSGEALAPPLLEPTFYERLTQA
jgi:hypothetical protein